MRTLGASNLTMVFNYKRWTALSNYANKNWFYMYQSLLPTPKVLPFLASTSKAVGRAAVGRAAVGAERSRWKEIRGMNNNWAVFFLLKWLKWENHPKLYQRLPGCVFLPPPFPQASPQCCFLLAWWTMPSRTKMAEVGGVLMSVLE